MKLTTLPLRQSLLTALDGNIIYQGKSIRVFEEFLQDTPTKKKAILTFGTVTAEAYVILLNQTSNEARSNKCNRNNDDSIQIQVTTVYPAGKGGSKVSEEIANIVLDLLFPTSVKETSLTVGGGIDLWHSDLLGSRNIQYDLTSSRVWITQLILECWIEQS